MKSSDGSFAVKIRAARDDDEEPVVEEEEDQEDDDEEVYYECIYTIDAEECDSAADVKECSVYLQRRKAHRAKLRSKDPYRKFPRRGGREGSLASVVGAVRDGLKAKASTADAALTTTMLSPTGMTMMTG